MDPTWLCGRDAYTGTCISFIKGQNERPAAVIELDEPITVDGTTGKIVVLELRYVGARWVKRETVHVELCDFMPEDKSWKDRKRGKWVESHASYAVI